MYDEPFTAGLRGERALLLLLLALAVLASPASIFAQEAAQEPESETPPAASIAAEEPPIEASEHPVSVEVRTDDAAIEARLTSILGASRQIESLELRVEEGIVFLTGEAPDAERRNWASSVARRTEGVVAVVNELGLKQAPIWTLRPARTALIDLWARTLRSVPLFLIGGVVLAVAIMIAGLVARGVGRTAERRLDSPILAAFSRRAAWVAVTLVGAYVALQVSGLTRLAATVLGGTSLIGLAFGFAFRDIAENFLSGILLSMQRPFRLGDTIEVSGTTGVVRGVTSHGTQLIDFDGNVVRLSNTSLYKGVIRNFTANPKCRDRFTVGIGYETPIERAQEVLLGVMREHEAVLEDPAPVVLVLEFGSSSVQLEAQYWIDGKRYSRARVRSTIMRQGLAALRAAEISMPDDAREVLFPEPLTMRLLEREERAPLRVERRADGPEPVASTPVAGGEGSLSSEVEVLEEQADVSGATPEDGGFLDREPAAG